MEIAAEVAAGTTPAAAVAVAGPSVVVDAVLEIPLSGCPGMMSQWPTPCYTIGDLGRVQMPPNTDLD